MPKLPKKKVGIIACSGEEIAEGTVTRLAALKVLEELRPDDTVTICLPLFLAGGEGDRAFARFYPTIAIDGCELRCAACATEQYSGKPAAGLVVADIMAESELEPPVGRRRLNEAGQQLVAETAARVADLVDDLLEKKWSRRQGSFMEDGAIGLDVAPPEQATCSCGSGIPVQTVKVDSKTVTLIALPALFEQFQQAGKSPSAEIAADLLEQVKIYNVIPDAEEEAYLDMLSREFALYCGQQKEALR